jgi:hypothetical protein
VAVFQNDVMLFKKAVERFCEDYEEKKKMQNPSCKIDKWKSTLLRQRALKDLPSKLLLNFLDSSVQYYSENGEESQHIVCTADGCLEKVKIIHVGISITLQTHS